MTHKYNLERHHHVVLRGKGRSGGWGVIISPFPKNKYKRIGRALFRIYTKTSLNTDAFSLFYLSTFLLFFPISKTHIFVIKNNI